MFFCINLKAQQKTFFATTRTSFQVDFWKATANLQKMFSLFNRFFLDFTIFISNGKRIILHNLFLFPREDEESFRILSISWKPDSKEILQPNLYTNSTILYFVVYLYFCIFVTWREYLLDWNLVTVKRLNRIKHEKCHQIKLIKLKFWLTYFRNSLAYKWTNFFSEYVMIWG